VGLIGGQLLLHFSVVRGRGLFLGVLTLVLFYFSSLRFRMSVVVRSFEFCLCVRDGGGMLLWWFSCIARVGRREWVAYIY